MTTRQIVHDILRDYPSTRDDDKKLLFTYWAHYTNNITTGEFINEHFEFIRDFIWYRAYWQNTKGMFLPTDLVKRARRKKQAKVVEAIREEKKNFVVHIYQYAKRIIRNK